MMRATPIVTAILAATVAVESPASPTEVPFQEFAMLSHPVTSFGAAIADGYLYLYGGHTGEAHSYSLEEQGHTLMRLNLDTKEWETLIEGPHLQGLALVAHDGKLYRIGGFTARNAKGEEDDLWSQSSVGCFDPTDDEWSELPSLPEPRSSFDAAVLGDVVYVVGGWSLQGGAPPHWHTTAWKMDLKQAQPEWEAVPSPPFQRRALAVAACNGKLYAIGGMQHEGGPTRRVDVFDPQTGAWSQGPDLLGDDGMVGFGAAACAAGGRLYVSTIKGDLQRLAADGARWELVGKTPTARFFHRMLPIDESHVLVVGGANMESGKFEEVEVLEVQSDGGAQP
jgi:N-acetylneuraminic acid mutarotase